jgi:two-component system chemotaxis sensor kinase CheA
MEYGEEIRDFLIESSENLAALDQEIVELEKNPTDEKLIASVFRTIHTIKGTSGFFGFEVLGSITHVAENLLGQVREKQRDLTPDLVSLVLETVDAVRLVLAHVEADNTEGEDVYGELKQRLDAAFHRAGVLPGGVPLETLLSDPAAPGAATSQEAAPQQAPARQAVAVEPGRTAEDHATHATIRVDVRLLDKLMNLVGELVLARNQILQGPASSTSGTAQRLNLITSELQESVMRTRMQPIGVVWNKLPRVVRDLASDLGKKITIQMEGAETELDKTIIEAIKDPLTHIVRNSCDHGVEDPQTRIAKGKGPQGTVLLRAFHEGGHVNIEISDDGAGIDAERIRSKALQKGLIRPEQAALMTESESLRLIFLPGFSTAERVTSISGRGVGMDVVKTNIEKIGGTVDLANRAEAGSTIKIKIPLTLAIIPGLIVTVVAGGSVPAGHAGESEAVREHRFVIPQANLLELVRLEGEKGRSQIEKINGAEVYRRRGKLLPLIYLTEVLKLPGSTKAKNVMNIVVVQSEETPFGLVVDDVSDTQEIVVKALGKQLKALACYIGATIMGDGRISLILDVTGIAKLAQLLAHPAERGKIEGKPRVDQDARQMLLLFRAGRFPRLVLPLSMVARLEEFPASRIEYAGGLPVLRYREAILPLISLSTLLDPGSAAPLLDGGALQVIVFREGEQSIGIVVDEILDIVDDAVTVKRAGSTFGLVGSGVVAGKVTDFVDLGAILKAADGNASHRVDAETAMMEYAR